MNGAREMMNLLYFAVEGEAAVVAVAGAAENGANDTIDYDSVILLVTATAVKEAM